MWGAAALCGTPGAAEGLSTQLAARGCSPAGSLQPRWAQGNQEGLGEGGLRPASTELHLVRDAGLIQSTCKCLSSFIFPAQNNLLSKVSSNKGGC